jgi:ferric-dicitrate binding protein FerR (iron transport regulator)
MPTWRLTFLVEPFPDTPWDRRELERWRQTAPDHAYAAVAQRRSVQISLDVDAEEERAAIAAGRAQVDASFPPWRYNVQNPPAPGVVAATQRALAAGVAAHLGGAGPRWFGEEDELSSPDLPPEAGASRRSGRLS